MRSFSGLNLAGVETYLRSFFGEKKVDAKVELWRIEASLRRKL